MKIMKRSEEKLCYLLFFILIWITVPILCEEERCSLGEFYCKTGTPRCIPRRWVCDGYDDCNDGSDEFRHNGTSGSGSQSCGDFSDTVIPRTCTEYEFACDGKCISKKWKCDGDVDCMDGSDESPDVCHNVTCKSDEFMCHKGPCIPLTWICDRSDDCSDGSDELNCVVTCAADEFLCKNTKCISKRWVCDDDDDCDDNSDEQGCGAVDCKPDEFRCANSEACIDSSYKCDGQNDCNDGSDEANCTHVGESTDITACSRSDFTCKSGDECIHQSWFCDGDEDCLDGSDEKHPNCTHTCRSDQFMCDDQQCIYNLLRCDKEKDCADGSDEVNCPHETVTCKPDEYACNTEGMCIPMSKVCDRKNDCGDFSDEKEELCSNKTDPCGDRNGGCSHTCVNLHNGNHICECPAGYKLLSDNKVCDDVDECKLWGTCPQQCSNLKGGYKCTCHDGYTKIPKNKSEPERCAALGPAPFLLFSNHKDLRKLNPHTLQDTKLFRGAQNAIAMDYNINSMHIYWSDVSHSKIFRAKFAKNFHQMDGQPEAVHENVKISDGIAVDWIHDNLYFSEAQSQVIYVSKSNGDHKKTLVSKDLHKPRAVAVDPRQGWVYWSDWGKEPKIERCGMNGAYRETLVHETIQWPNGLTIDFSTDRLYWVDAKLHIIASSKLDGQDRRTILYAPIKISHPFAITVFEELIYWTDWSVHAIRYTNKFTGEKVGSHHELLMKLNQPAGIHVVHPYRQPDAQNVCGTTNQGCSHLCLPAPRNSNSGESLDGQMLYSCACPDGLHLAEDGKKCTEISLITSTTKPSSVTSTNTPVSSTKPVSTTPTPITHSTTASPDINNSFKKGNVTAPNNSTGQPVVQTTEGTGFHEIGTKGNYTHVEPTIIPEQKDEESVGLVTGIVIGCAICLLLLIIVVGYILYRNHTKRNIRSMNFDNPVYRKTTDDQFGIDKKGSVKSIPSTLQPLTSTPDEVV